MLVGIAILFESGSSHVSTSVEFGADFYTYSVKYTAYAVNAIADLHHTVSMLGGMLLLFLGGVDICVTLLHTEFPALMAGERPAVVAAEASEEKDETEKPEQETVVSEE